MDKNHIEVVARLRDRILDFVYAAEALGASSQEGAEALCSALATLAMQTTDPVGAVSNAAKAIVRAVEGAVAAEAAAKAAAPPAPEAPVEDK